MKTLEELKTDVEKEVNGAKVDIEAGSLRIEKTQWLGAAKHLKLAHHMDYLSCLTGVDHKDHFEVVYHLYSMFKQEGPLAVKVSVSKNSPEIDSVTCVWRGAEFQEREAYDMYGIRFQGHPDLRRILMWDEFEHYPMRKDYVPENQNRPREEF